MEAMEEMDLLLVGLEVVVEDMEAMEELMEVVVEDMEEMAEIMLEVEEDMEKQLKVEAEKEVVEDIMLQEAISVEEEDHMGVEEMDIRMEVMVEAVALMLKVEMVFALFSIGYNINYLNNKAIGFFLSPSVFLL